MTMKKKVSSSLKNILEDEEVQIILNRSSDVNTIAETITNMWGYDLYSRKPGPAYTSNGEFQGTDLDMACFMSELAKRKAVINIPKYKSLRQASVKEGQILTSKDNRHGQILSVGSNKETFVFSILIKDQNVISTSDVGDFRRFVLTNFEGEFYTGWQTIQFLPTEKENKFIYESRILSENKIIFKNFVHPNRWISFYGKPYFKTKLMIMRLEDECSYLNSQISQMLKAGIKYPEKEEIKKDYPKSISVGEKKSIKVPAFQVELDVPENNSVYENYEFTQENLIKLTDKRKYLFDTVLPHLRFHTRITEFAFYKYGRDKELPSWMENITWEKDFVPKGKRTKWDRLVLFQPKVGEFGVSIRKRLYEKSETVSANADTE